MTVMNPVQRRLTLDALDRALEKLSTSTFPISITEMIASYASQHLDWDAEHSTRDTVPNRDSTVFVAAGNQKYSLASGAQRMSKHLSYSVRLRARGFDTDSAFLHVGLLLIENADHLPSINSIPRKAVYCHKLHIGPSFRASPRNETTVHLTISLKRGFMVVGECAVGVNSGERPAGTDSGERLGTNSAKVSIATEYGADAHLLFRVTKRVQLRILEMRICD